MAVTSLWTAAVLLVVSSSALAGDWAQYRGPAGNSVTPDSSGWTPGQAPAKLWNKSVGRGSSSPIIAGGKVYVMGFQGNKDTVYCFDVKTGEETWKQSYAQPERTRYHNADEGNYGGPLATPSFDAATGYLYTLGCDGDLKCWDTAKKGAEVWSKNLFTELGVKQRRGHDYGCTANPQIIGDVVVCEVSSPGGTLTAFDKKTGAKKWVSAYKNDSGHTGGPAVMNIGGSTCLAYMALNDVVVIGVDKGNEGKLFGSTKWTTAWQANIPSPTAAGDKLVVTSDYGNKTKCYSVSAGGLKELWTSGPAAKCFSPVIYKDLVYLIDGSMKCVDLATGKEKWQGGKFGGSSDGTCVVCAGDNKILAWAPGKLSLLEAGANEYKELDSISGLPSGKAYPQPAVSDGYIVVKDENGGVACVGTKK
jgi:outer membrane protein assembly factor BamB